MSKGNDNKEKVFSKFSVKAEWKEKDKEYPQVGAIWEKEYNGKKFLSGNIEFKGLKLVVSMWENKYPKNNHPKFKITTKAIDLDAFYESLKIAKYKKDKSKDLEDFEEVKEETYIDNDDDIDF